MLFSQDDVAQFVSTNFEPVWESVRPVPIVRIDFGNGKVITRTLHGNIATYVCASDGEVVDILPGIYMPQTYLDRLNQFRLLASYVDQLGKDKRVGRLQQYHRQQAEALKQNQPAARFVEEVDPQALLDVTKAKIERFPKRVFAKLVAGERSNGPNAKEENPKVDTPVDLATWKALAEDTRLNETVRRRQIHEKLLAGSVRPSTVVKWLYKEVLHADLDDPTLGLESVLSANYPFAAEDKR